MTRLLILGIIRTMARLYIRELLKARNNSVPINKILAKSVLNHLIHSLSIILNISLKILDSISRCNQQMLHNRIISDSDLLTQLNKTKLLYPKNSPFPVSHQTLNAYSKLVRPSCVTKKQQIIHFLLLALFSPKNYQLVHLLFTLNQRYQIVIP